MVILVPHLLTKHSPIYRAPKANDRIPTIHFQVLLLLVSGSVAQTTKMKRAYSVAYIYWNSMASSGIRHFFGGVSQKPSISCISSPIYPTNNQGPFFNCSFGEFFMSKLSYKDPTREIVWTFQMIPKHRNGSPQFGILNIHFGMLGWALNRFNSQKNLLNDKTCRTPTVNKLDLPGKYSRCG